MSELLPCPFCGCSVDYQRVEFGGVPRVIVRCCSADTGRWPTKRDAAIRWNRRSQPPAQAVPMLTDAERELFSQTIEGFADCGETETPYEVLVDWAQRGLMECTHFQPTAAGHRALAAGGESAPVDTWTDIKERCNHGVRWENRCGACNAPAPMLTLREIAKATFPFAHVRSDYTIGIARAIESLIHSKLKAQAALEERQPLSMSMFASKADYEAAVKAAGLKT